MFLGLLGDIHGAFDALERVLALEPDVPAWVCVGDVASEAALYPSPSRPFYFIKGNNEDFDVIARLTAGEAFAPNLHYVPNGTAVAIPAGATTGATPASTSATPASTGETQVSTGATPVSTGETPTSTGGTPVSTGETPVLHAPNDSPGVGQASRLSELRVAGLGGTYAPKWFDTAPEALPAGRRDGASRRSGAAAKADKRRHFVRREVEACAALRDIDIFLTHEAARPYWVGTGRGRNDAGKTAINEVLAAMKPRLHLFGHHHRFSEAVREGVPSIGLPLVTDGHGVLDTVAWTWTFRSGPQRPG